MNRGVQYILWFWIALCGLSCLYFILLVPGLPFWATLIVAGGWLAFVYWLQLLVGATLEEDITIGRLTIALIAICLGLFISNAVSLADKHGGWDAFAIWNLHARCLVDPAHWQNMFLNTDTEHPDYPPMQPAAIAFLFRLSGGAHQELISFAFAALITLSVPVLLLARSWDRNKLVALAMFYLLCRDPFFIASGVSQYADMLVAFLVLAAFICLEDAAERPELAGLAAFFLGSAAATKNEGAILAILMMLFYARHFFRRAAIGYTLAGIVLPLCTLLLFKAVCPVHNDMALSLSRESLHRLSDWHRYQTIYNYLNEVIDQKFGYIQIGLLLAFLVSLFRKSLPSRGAAFVFATLAAYFFIYVVTPHDLEWHLHTSADRLLLQLAPVTCYLITARLSVAGASILSFNGRNMF